MLSHLRFLNCLLVLIVAVTELRGQDSVSFREKVAPILLDNCVSCHGPKRAEGGYRLDTFELLAKAGDSGISPLGDLKLESNELVRRLQTPSVEERMPAESEPLLASEIEIVRNWISAGAKFDGVAPTDSLLKTIPPVRYPAPPVSYVVPVPITASAFSPDGSLLFVSGYHELTVWNVTDGNLVRRVQNLGQRIFAIAFSPDAKTIAVACGTPGKLGEVRLIDAATYEVTSTLIRLPDVILDLAFRPSKNELAIAAADSSIRILDLTSKAERIAITSHADWINAIAWSPDGSRLASASRDKSSKVFDGESGDLLASFQGHNAPVRGVAFSSDGKQIFSAGMDNKVIRWEIEGVKAIAELPIGSEPYRIVRSENLLLVPAIDKSLHRFDATSNAQLPTLAGHSEWVLSTSIHSASQLAASGTINGEVAIWNLADGTLKRLFVAKP